ncbi:hypothetical protein [Brevibacillus brevis]|uniref:Uncharacterized protein n=1 Tax=Brevibacillus brevis TaxID=1393 RepID=A0ABY9TDH1_BREBE|nr:hypothetical protein [Brevibacillus brevis]WNC17942.1 hypothetical protein RGB73_30265 [Brevibacillus brevis]
MEFKKGITNRGFNIIEFQDRYGTECSIQKSSLAFENAIWLGVNDANPQIMASKVREGGTGWLPYEIPKDVVLTTRMHLTQDQVKALLPILTVFAETGDLPQ